MFNQIPRRSYQFLFLVFALALMVLPVGVAMSFADGPDSQVPSLFPYFSLTPFGYGNWFPLLAGVLTLAVLVMLFFPEKYKLKKPMAICLGLGMVCSPLSWLIFGTFCGGSVAILVCQAATLLFLVVPSRKGA